MLARTGKSGIPDLLKMGEASEMPFRCGGALLQLEARPARGDILNERKDLHAARAALVKDKTAAKNRANNLMLALLKRQNAARLKQIERQLEAIEKTILALIKGDPGLAGFDIVTSIAGVSDIRSHHRHAGVGNTRSWTGREPCGPCSVARQWGHWPGRAFIRRGRANVRQALYMQALVAIRFNPDLKANEKPAKVAITAIMRKLLVLANALREDRRKWSPRPA
jgi:transposase